MAMHLPFCGCEECAPMSFRPPTWSTVTTTTTIAPPIIQGLNIEDVIAASEQLAYDHATIERLRRERNNVKSKLASIRYTAFCLQWVAIAFGMLVGDPRDPATARGHGR